LARPRTRTAVLISGRGSNLAALIEACAAPDYPAEIVVVIANEPGAGGLTHAAAAAIPALVVDHRTFPTKAGFETALDRTLRDSSVELICLAGFMRLLSAHFVEAWRDRILNIHPSLLPAFPGLHTHERATVARVERHGATVHFVRAETDAGPIVVQGAVPVLPGDTPETLAARTLEIEHRIYPLALKLVASGAATVSGERVVLSGLREALPGVIWPGD
jgi:phosphoribosylglycinamide formyltransferase-1